MWFHRLSFLRQHLCLAVLLRCTIHVFDPSPQDTSGGDKGGPRDRSVQARKLFGALALSGPLWPSALCPVPSLGLSCPPAVLPPPAPSCPPDQISGAGGFYHEVGLGGPGRGEMTIVARDGANPADPTARHAAVLPCAHTLPSEGYFKDGAFPCGPQAAKAMKIPVASLAELLTCVETALFGPGGAAVFNSIALSHSGPGWVALAASSDTPVG